MKLICHNEEGKKIFNDGDKWVWITPDAKINKTSISKKEKPLFPFFAITKWRYKIDDKESFLQLKKEYEKQQVF